MDWLFDDDDQIFEDDGALRRSFLNREASRFGYCGSESDIDNDYEELRTAGNNKTR